MKKIISFLIFIAAQFYLTACPVCDRQQPKFMRGVVHGIGPQDKWDYISVTVMIILAIITLFYSVKWLIKPGEKNSNHIKYSILNEY